MSDEKDFTVYFTNPASTSVQVKAENHEAAIELAWDQVHGSPCNQCSNQFELAGDWEPICVIDDETNEILWEEPV